MTSYTLGINFELLLRRQDADHLVLSLTIETNGRKRSLFEHIFRSSKNASDDTKIVKEILESFMTARLEEEPVQLQIAQVIFHGLLAQAENLVKQVLLE